MSARLDLYLEKLIAKMNLDDTQAADVKREFRAHLEEAIENGMREGLAPDEAEQQAMVAFGQPTLLARQFGIVPGFVWILFEKAALALLMYVFFRFLLVDMEHAPPPWGNILAMLYAALVMYEGLWRKVEVNGVLRVRRLFRRTVAIPFDDVREVRFEKGHVFGARGIVVAYPDGKVRFSRWYRGVRAATMALEVLTRSRVRPEVLKYFQKVRFRVRTEGLLFRMLFTALWLAVLTLGVLAFPATWEMVRISLFFFGAWLLALIVGAIQPISYCSYAKRGLAWLLLIGILFSGSAIVMLYAGNAETARRVFLLLPACGFAAVWLLWWRGGRRRLFAGVGAIAIAWVGAGFLIPPVWTGTTRTLARTAYFLPETARWGGKGRNTFVALGPIPSLDDGNSYIVEIGKDGTRGGALDWDGWKLISDPTTATLILTRSNPYNSGGAGRGKGFLITAANSFRPIRGFPKNAVDLPSLVVPSRSRCSPDRRFLVVATPSGKKGRTRWASDPVLTVVNTRTGTNQRFQQFSAYRICGWIDNTHLRVVRSESIGHVPRSKQRTREEVWALDVATSNAVREREFLTQPGFSIQRTLDESHAILSNLLESQNKMIDLATGETHSLPNGAIAEMILAHTLSGPRVVYLNGKGHGNTIVVAGPQGVIAEIPLGTIGHVVPEALSPDGKKLLVAVSDSHGSFLLALTSLRVVDLVRHRVTPIATMATIQSFMFQFSPSGGTAIRWTPDSRSVIYPEFAVVRDGTHIYRVTAFQEADYENWAQKHL